MRRVRLGRARANGFAHTSVSIIAVYSNGEVRASCSLRFISSTQHALFGEPVGAIWSGLAQPSGPDWTIWVRNLLPKAACKQVRDVCACAMLYLPRTKRRNPKAEDAGRVACIAPARRRSSSIVHSHVGGLPHAQQLCSGYPNCTPPVHSAPNRNPPALHHWAA